MISWWPLGALIILMQSIGTAQDVPLNGASSCPCIPIGGIPDISFSDITPSLQEHLGTDVSLVTYGFSCRPHDINSAACYSYPRPDFCIHQWCWIDVDNCDLLSRLSENIVHGGFRSYSYATCRDIDSFTGEARIRALSGKVIKTGYLHNSGGWKGAYSTEKKDFVGTISSWNGPSVAYTTEAARIGNYTIEVAAPPEFLWFKSLGFFGVSQVDFCIYATSLGFLDLCVSEIPITAKRASAVDFFVLNSHRIQIMTMEKEPSSRYKEFQQSSSTIFKPFRKSTWLFIIFVVIPIFGVLLVIHEYGKRGSHYPEKAHFLEVHEWRKDKIVDERSVPIYRYLIRSIHFTFLSVLQQGYVQPVVSDGARLHILGISFFILVIIAVYTANLAAILTQNATRSEVLTLEDIVLRNYRICASRSVYTLLEQIYGIGVNNFVMDPPEIGGDSQPGFQCASCESRRRVLDFTDPVRADTDANYCHVAITYIDDLAAEQGAGRHCNKTIVGSTLAIAESGFPIFNGVSAQLVAHFLQLKNLGIYEKILLEARPISKCSVKSSKTGTSGGEGFTIADLTGIWTVSFGYAAAGLLMAFGLPLFNKCCKRNRIKAIHRIDQNGERINRLENPLEYASEENLQGSDVSSDDTSNMDDDSTDRGKPRARAGSGDSTSSWPTELRDGFISPFPKKNTLATVNEDEFSLEVSLDMLDNL